MRRLNTIQFAAALLLVACTKSTSELAVNSPIESFASQPMNFRVSLTDAPIDGFTNVFVNIDSLELWLEKGGKEARLIVGKDRGLVDLLTLRNGVVLPIADFQMPVGVTVKEIRILVKPDLNYALYGDGQYCALQTPSAQVSGVKLKLSAPVTVEPGYSYSIVYDFDAEKSVVKKGQGDCLLKPVLKLGGFTRIGIEDSEGSLPTQPGEDLNSPGTQPESEEWQPNMGYELPPDIDLDGLATFFSE